MIIKNRIKQLSQNKILIMHSLWKTLWTYCIFMIWVNKSKHFWPCLMVIDMYVLVEFAATSYGKTHLNILYVWGIYWDGCGCVVPKVGYISKWGSLAFLFCVWVVCGRGCGGKHLIFRCLSHLWTCTCHPKGQLHPSWGNPVNLTVRLNPTKRESQKAQLQH